METNGSINGSLTCPNCGAVFTCQMAAGEATCWCFDLPRVMPIDSREASAGCLCPACLRAAIQEKIKAKSNS